MREFNYLNLLLIVLMQSVIFVSCSKEDEIPNNKDNSMRNTQSNNQTIVDYCFEDSTYGEEENTAYVFQKNGKYIELRYRYNRIDKKLLGTYDMSGGRLHLYYDGDKEGKDYLDSHDKITLTESKMILTEDDGDKDTSYRVSNLIGYAN